MIWYVSAAFFFLPSAYVVRREVMFSQLVLGELCVTHIAQPEISKTIQINLLQEIQWCHWKMAKRQFPKLLSMLWKVKSYFEPIHIWAMGYEQRLLKCKQSAKLTQVKCDYLPFQWVMHRKLLTKHTHRCLLTTPSHNSFTGPRSLLGGTPARTGWGNPG